MTCLARARSFPASANLRGLLFVMNSQAMTWASAKLRGQADDSFGKAGVDDASASSEADADEEPPLDVDEAAAHSALQ
jgi:hypothetical protein